MRWTFVACLVAAFGCVAGAYAAPVVLDADGDRLLLGTPAEVKGAGDVGLEMAIELRVGGKAQAWPLVKTAVEQARLLPGGRALAVTPGHTLLEVDVGAGTSEVLDEGVVGAVGASPDGRYLVYCKGEAPELEVWLLERGEKPGAPRPITTDMAPTWSPAVSADGRRVVFTSSRSGVPALWIAEGGAPRQITNIGVAFVPGQAPTLTPTPAALSPVVYAGGLIAFEAAGAVHVVNDRGAPVRSVPGAAPHWIVPGRTLGVVRAGKVVAVDLGAKP